MVHMHLVKRAGHHEYEYRYFFVDVAGHPRIYLENSETTPLKPGEKPAYKLFGIKLG
jgi:import inner membrane translocase subunit TIM21